MYKGYMGYGGMARVQGPSPDHLRAFHGFYGRLLFPSINCNINIHFFPQNWKLGNGDGYLYGLGTYVSSTLKSVYSSESKYKSKIKFMVKEYISPVLGCWRTTIMFNNVSNVKSLSNFKSTKANQYRLLIWDYCRRILT